MKFKLRGASSAALLVGLAGALPVWAQQSAPQPPVDQVAQPQQEDEEADRVVVTGSYIQGTPEDAALPVEVYSQEELAQQGAPTALEFAKSLSIAGPTTGEAYYFSGAALTGSVNYNLRGLGADKTLTLLNGRRMSQNTSNIPSAALARTEILKDGAAVTYGADATGGVVNFITRDDFVGFEVGGQYKYIAGSDGDYGLSMLAGFGEGDTNLLFSAEWEHRSRLEAEERGFSSQPYDINPAPWSTTTNMATWTPRGALPAVPSPFLLAPPPASMNAAAEFGAGLSAAGVADFTPASCAAVGGKFIPNGVTTGINACAYGYASYYNIVEVNDIYRGYAQLNTSINENMDFHFDASYGQVKSPQVFGSPAQPVIRGPGLTTGGSSQFYIPSTNPYVAAFATRTGWATNPLFASTAGYTAVSYRAFAHGGNPFLGTGNGYGVPSKIDNQVWRVSAAIDGTLGDWAGPLSDVGYDVALTYNQAISYGDAPDIMGYRLQQALAGFGGPNCSVQDLDPLRLGTQNNTIGTSAAARAALGCYYWNPFASSFATQPELGLANPNYVAGQENREDVARWLFDTRADESTSSSLTLDAVVNGRIPIVLPGGDIGWAGGIQVRQNEFRENITSPNYNGQVPCEWPIEYRQNPQPVGTPSATNTFNGCTPDSPGPFVFFGLNRPDYNDQQQASLFAEFQIPLLDNVNIQAAVRREEFSGGLGATVYKVSGKWDVFGPLSLRGSYGTNYQAPPASLIPGNVTNGVNSYTKVAGAWLGTQTETRSDVVPETATSWNVGAIWQSEGFAADHNLRIILDYFDIETEDELGLLATVNDIAASIFPGVNTGAALANCAHPLISRVSFNGGVCTQGVTTARDFSSIKTEFGNGPGQHTAGYDLQISYDLPFGPGDLTLSATATQTTTDENTATILDGFTVAPADDRLGFLNFAVVGFASPELRGNASVNYRMDQHNFRLGMNYISGVDDERFPTAASTTPLGGIGPTGWGIKGKDWMVFDFTYLFELSETLRFTSTIGNILDKDPPQSRQELGYDPRQGNPLGRTIEFSVKKTF